MKSEYELLDDAVDELSRTQVFPLVFGGLAGSDGVHISALRGHCTPHLAGLHVRLHRGLGGRSMSERRPRLTPDYRGARGITHDYDREVLGERVRTLLAVPIVVDDRVRGVLYGAQRLDCSVGAVAIDPVVAIAERVRRALAERDRFERLRIEREIAATAARAARTAAPGGQAVRAGSAPETASPVLDAARLERLREGFVELRSIRAEIADPAIAARLRALEQELAGIGGGGFALGDDEAEPRAAGSPDAGAEPAVRLSPRELDVLGHAALGLRNAEIGRELGLTESTVKSYMGAAMQKLGRGSRHAAVSEARRQGLLP